MAVAEEVLGTFHGSDEFPIEWQEGEKELFWIYDDLHIPNPVSPMFFDIGGWWLTCDHMFRRFGTPFACDWVAKQINGYVYTAAVPADSSIHSEATEYQARYVPRVPRDPEHAGKIGAYLGWVLPHYAGNFLEWWRQRLRPEIMLNFAQFASTQALNALLEEQKGEAAARLMGRLQSSLEDRNWDSIEDLWRMKEEIKGVEGEAGAELEGALNRSLSMNPLTPDHHFYVDQGTNARLRLVLIAIGEKLVCAGTLDEAEDVMYLRYNELRLLMADQGAFDARAIVGDRRDAREAAFAKRPPSWVGTATQTALDFPYNALWGFPEKFFAGEPSTTGEVRGLAASPGVVEGSARYVRSLAEFDQVKEGEILVCRMTNPAWVVLFTKIAGLVTEAGGAVSHPAVVAPGLGIPAVVGTTNAGERIKTGDRIRVNGTTGVVELLS